MKRYAVYDPEAAGKPYLIYVSSIKKVAGRYVHNGEVTVEDLEFNDGLLFVRGDVAATGFKQLEKLAPADSQ